jgi:hypothetical protein
MEKTILLTLTIIAFIHSSAQTYLQGRPRGFTEVGVQGGITGYLGDLGGTLGSGSKSPTDYDSRLPNIMASINATYALTGWLSLRPNVAVMQILGDDKSLSTAGAGDKSSYYRNLSFRSMIYEGAVLAEVNPFYLLPRYAEKEHRFYPYGAAGLGVFHFNPKANLNGKWHALQPLSTEGQGMEEYPDRKIYKRVQLNIPVGAGFKYYLNPGFYVGAEAMYRKTFTDYLDDVSTTYINPELFDKYFTAEQAEVARQLSYRSLTRPEYQAGGIRGSAKNKDGYFTIGLRLGIVLGGFE